MKMEELKDLDTEIQSNCHLYTLTVHIKQGGVGSVIYLFYWGKNLCSPNFYFWHNFQPNFLMCLLVLQITDNWPVAMLLMYLLGVFRVSFEILHKSNYGWGKKSWFLPANVGLSVRYFSILFHHLTVIFREISWPSSQKELSPSRNWNREWEYISSTKLLLWEGLWNTQERWIGLPSPPKFSMIAPYIYRL